MNGYPLFLFSPLDFDDFDARYNGERDARVIAKIV